MTPSNTLDIAKELEAIREAQRNDKRFAVDCPTAATWLGLALPTVRREVSEGRIVSYLDGRKRLIPVSAIYRRLVANLEASTGGAGARPRKHHEFRGVRPSEKAKAAAGR